MFFVTVLIIYTTFSKCYTCVIASNKPFHLSPLAITRLFIRLLAFSQLPYGFIIRAFTQVVQ
nr:MAG TPA: hypothetical protein [Caudoviricetes sp.]